MQKSTYARQLTANCRMSLAVKQLASRKEKTKVYCSDITLMPAQRSNPFLAQAGEHVKFKGSRSSGSVVFSKEGRHRLRTVQSEQACSKKHHLDASCDEVKNEKFINSQPASRPRSSTSVNDLRAELDFRPAAFTRIRIRQWRIASLFQTLNLGRVY